LSAAQEMAEAVGLDSLAGACDCHIHIIGTPDVYPFAEDRTYTPGPASVPALRAHLDSIGFTRMVVVQPSVYGTDNRCTLDGMREFGPEARGVAVIGDDIEDAELDALHAAGIRGIRVNVESAGIAGTDAVVAETHRVGKLVARLGWHVQLFVSAKIVQESVSQLTDVGVPVVFDHFAKVTHEGNGVAPAFRPLLDLIASGKAYVKLSALYRHEFAKDEDALTGVVRDFVDANEDRCVWASDWPHTSNSRRTPETRLQIEPYRDIDNKDVVIGLARRIGDPAKLKKVLIDNPARLYDYTGDNA
jgi:predicted TIM-barrel fold metal-dependent hydrolase